MWEQTVRKILFWTGGMGFLLGMLFLLTYRYCEQAGPAAEKACTAAAITAAAGGIGAFWPLLKMWNRKQTAGIIAVMIGNGIRMLVGFIGVALILFFVEVNPKWFLGCFGIFYLGFLLTGSWLAICLLHHHGLKEDNLEYEQFRDITCQHGSARRYYQ